MKEKKQKDVEEERKHKVLIDAEFLMNRIKTDFMELTLIVDKMKFEIETKK